MSEKRFTWKTEKLQHSDDEVLLVVDNVNKEWKGHILNIVALLNEQQTTIEYLTKSRDRWRELSNSFSFYCKCYEKAIERAFEEKPYPTEDDINRIYAELEKELEDG